VEEKNLKLLLHICCGPCAVYPVNLLRREGTGVVGYFYRNNIHPYTECIRREETLKTYAGAVDLKVIYPEGYDIAGFFRSVVFREKDRCVCCYHDRLRAAARIAKHGDFDAFSSTLLYSRYQKHETIRNIGEAIGTETGIPFLYRDFREGWKEGIEASRRLGLYRQQYCGCVYSEAERYAAPKRRKTAGAAS
jgi:epoxyqueuosine reductase